MKNRKKYILSIIICFLVIIVVFEIFNLFFSKDVSKKLDLNKVSYNYKVHDSDGMMLYHRYQPEDGLLFNLIGNNGFKDYYAYYFKKNKIDNLSNFVKNIILLNDADYTKFNYDDKNNCYQISYDDYKIIYDKLFNDADYILNFDEEFISINYNDKDVCVKEFRTSNYKKVLDTYLVNIVRLNGKIIVYERVAFIKITDEKLIFYSDYKMKNEVYSLDAEKVDISFINNSEIVSNVLLQYQNDFPLYQYTYIKGVDTYYLESIEK